MNARETALAQALSDLITTIERHTDCMDGRIHREALDEYMKRGEAALAMPRTESFDLVAHLHHQREWSERTFGPGDRAVGVVDHIIKELHEILDSPGDLSEWIDVAILALDGAWRAGHSPEQIVAALVAKQTRNELRRWPDWRTAEPGKAIEHVREAGE